MSGKLSRSFGNISRERVAETARRHGVRSVRVFGSVAQGTDTQESDLDLLVEFEPGRDLFDLIALKSYLEIIWEVVENRLTPLRDQLLSFLETDDR